MGGKSAKKKGCNAVARLKRFLWPGHNEMPHNVVVHNSPPGRQRGQRIQSGMLLWGYQTAMSPAMKCGPFTLSRMPKFPNLMQMTNYGIPSFTYTLPDGIKNMAWTPEGMRQKNTPARYRRFLPAGRVSGDQAF